MEKIRRLGTIEIYLPMLMCSLYLLNYVIQFSPFAGLYYHIFNVLYISILVFLVLNKKMDVFYILVLFYFVVCHQYASDPYNENFKNYLSGFYKFIVLSLLLPFIKIIFLIFCFIILIQLYSAVLR